MKMPTALVAGPGRALQWKPGQSMSLSYGEGTFSLPAPQDTRLPLVTQRPDPSLLTHLPRPPLSGREKRRKEESGSSSLPASSSLWTGEERRKRFPILGPTRQETEMYFRSRRCGRRSAKHRLKAETTPLVTRSAARVVLPESSPTPRLTHTKSTTITTTNNDNTTTTAASITSSVHTTTTAIITTTSVTENKMTTTGGVTQTGVSHADLDTGYPEDKAETIQNTLPHFERGPGSPTAPLFLPGFDPGAGAQSMTTPSPAVERLENSPEPLTRDGGKKKPEAPIVSEFGQQFQRMLRMQREERQKTLQPSKHGFHRRSKSPTFKRLVAAAEKLQNVAVGSDYDDQRMNRCSPHAGRASPDGVVLPAVAGAWDGGGGGEAEEEQSDEEVTYLYTHPFLSSISHSLYRSKHYGRVTQEKPRLTRSTGTNIFSYPKDPEIFPQKGTDDPHANIDLTYGWGAWEVDSLRVESGMEPARLTIPSGTTSSDTHTELHLFLPRLADMASDDGSSKASPVRHRSKPVKDQPQNPVGERGGKGIPQPMRSQRGPQRSHSQLHPWIGERSGRSQERRFTSPVRAAKRDKTPSSRRPVVPGAPVGSYELYEPYIKGEHLKEKLDDLPTLISLEQD